jgi:hypothetical protein
MERIGKRARMVALLLTRLLPEKGGVANKAPKYAAGRKGVAASEIGIREQAG